MPILICACNKEVIDDVIASTSTALQLLKKGGKSVTNPHKNQWWGFSML